MPSMTVLLPLMSTLLTKCAIFSDSQNKIVLILHSIWAMMRIRIIIENLKIFVVIFIRRWWALYYEL